MPKGRPRGRRGRVVLGQARVADDASFQKTVQPFLAKNCFACHNEKLKTANLSLEGFHDAASAARQPEVWGKVLDKLSAGKMPPPGLPPIPKAEVAAVTSWIEGMVKQPAANREPDPGRVTAHRLNRVEYNNTIRDLLGVSVHPADEFPVDDSGYGFDNIGDVLSVSPMLMEKYMAAANQVARLAVYGETLPAKPSRLTRLLNSRSGDAAENSKGGYLPYSIRGAMYGTWVFPVDGEYEFRLRVANFRGDTEDRLPRERTPEEGKARREARKIAPRVKLVLALDGAPIITGAVESEAAVSADERFLPEYTARVPVKAGERFLRASFPEFADLDDPRQNITPKLRRWVFVDYLDIVGPFNPSVEPPQSYRRIFICGHTKGQHRPECARLIVENLVRRAYRRPVTPQEIDAKLKLVSLKQKEGDSLEEGVRLALKAILVSPNFLFRVERDPRPDSKEAAAPHFISEYELASRLSYFLWSSMPDEELFRAAREQKLRQPGVLEAQIRRMMADPKAKNLVDNFAAQWLQMRNLGRVKPDPARFPTVDDELLDAMRRETSLFVETVIREDRSVLDFIDAPFTFVNGPLARHYGIPGVSGEEFQRVKLDGEQRGGLLTQGAILTVSSYPTRTSPRSGASGCSRTCWGPRLRRLLRMFPCSMIRRSARPYRCASGWSSTARIRAAPLPQHDGSDRTRPRKLRWGRRLAHSRRQGGDRHVRNSAGRKVVQGGAGLETAAQEPIRRFHPPSDREPVDVRAGQGPGTIR